MMDQSEIWTQASWISCQMLYLLSYLAPPFKPVWLSHFSSSSPSKITLGSLTFPWQKLTCLFQGLAWHQMSGYGRNNDGPDQDEPWAPSISSHVLLYQQLELRVQYPTSIFKLDRPSHNTSIFKLDWLSNNTLQNYHTL